MQNNYFPPRLEIWQGQSGHPDAFHWHQRIEPLDLSDNDRSPFDGPLGIALLGFLSDKGIEKNDGRTGASRGPQAIRKELSGLPCNFSPQLRLFDAGDITAESSSLAQAQEALSEAVTRILSLNLFPILLGGGHEIAYGHYMGLQQYFRGKEKPLRIGIFNFDAHFDHRPYDEGATSGTMFRQIGDEKKQHGEPRDYFVLGIQPGSNASSLFRYADQSGAQYILAEEMGQSSVYEKLDTFLAPLGGVYLTVDADVFSSGIAPGVSAPAPLGLLPNEVLPLLRHILRSGKW